MHKQKIFISALSLIMVSAQARAELPEWKQNFAGCALSSAPYAQNNLFKNAKDVRPLMQISGMNAWAITDENGTKKIALTTTDGLTIYGQIFGPQGEDISGALLATSPTVQADKAISTTNENVSARSPDKTVTTRAEQRMPNNLETVQQQQPSNSTNSVSTAEIPADPLERLIQQAETFTMWIQATKPKDVSKAPVIYVLVDPTCPYCAMSFETMRDIIEQNTIDLRVILAPIRSAEAFDIAASILHQENVPKALFEHSKTLIGGGSPVKMLDPKKYDPNVTEGLKRNVMWMRANQMQGVPFYLFRTDKGPQFAFGQITLDQIKQALPAATQSSER